MSASNPKQFAKQICEYLKKLPDKYADDPQDVQDALGLSDANFKAGLDWCVERKLITLDKASDAAPAPAAAPKPASSSPFTIDDEDETVGDRKSVFASAVAAKDDDDDEDETLGDREGVFGAGEPAGVG